MSQLTRALTFTPTVAGALALAPKPSAAGLVDDGVSDCGPANCQSQVIQGRVEVAGFGNQPVPFVAQILGIASTCLRVDVTKLVFLGITFPDLKMILVSPSGTIWRNDDKSAQSTNPLISINAPETGYYTLQVSNVGDLYPIDFTLKYGLCQPGTGHCDSITPAV